MSRIYNSCVEMLSEEFRNLMELGIEVQSSTMQDKDIRNNEEYKTKELIANSFTILDTNDKEEMYKVMRSKYNIDLNKEWADKEFEERINDKKINPGKAYKLRKEVWKEFIHNGKFSYSYNERIRQNKYKIIEELKKNITTRQAILPIWNYYDLKYLGGKERIPCSILYSFFIRKINNKDKLNMIYIMRSSDLLTHFVNDVYLAIKMQEYIAEKVEIEKGIFTMFISSFHAYYKDLKKYNIF